MSRISGLCGNFVVVPFYIPTSNIWEFQFMYILSITCYCSFSCSIEQFQLSKQVQIEVLWHLPHVCKLCVWPSGPAPERHSLIRSDQSSRSVVSHSATPWIAGWQASLSITNSRSSLRLMTIESVMPSNHLILCHPLLILPPIPPSIRVFSNVSTLCMRWPKYWSFSFSIISSKEIPGLISFTEHLFKTKSVFLLFFNWKVIAL